MRMRGEREARESRIASGWIVEGDSAPADQAPSESAPAEPAQVESAQVEAVADPASDAAAETEGAGDEAAEPRRQMSGGVVILLGVLGGLYLLYTWVWFSWASYYSSVNAAIAAGSGTLGSVMQQITFWAAPLAPILWFLSVLAVVGVSRTRALVTWLLIGAVVLVPLPMLIYGGA